MRNELVAGTSNVVRFPVERRSTATPELLRRVAPDVREMANLAESFGFSPPDPHARHEEDRLTAEFIANHIAPEPGPIRREALDDLLAEAVGTAVAACHAAQDAAGLAEDARRRLILAQSEGGYWLPPIEQRADVLTTAAARLMLEAHELSECAEGVARAVGLARRNEPWRPFDLQSEVAALFGLTG